MFCISLKFIFYRQYIRTHLVHFEVENEILDIGYYDVFGFTCQDDQNELSNKIFEQIWNFTIQEKKLENYFYLNRNLYDPK